MNYWFNINSLGTVKLYISLSCYVEATGYGFATVGVLLYDSNGKLVGSSNCRATEAVAGLYFTDTVTFEIREPDNYTVEIRTAI